MHPDVARTAERQAHAAVAGGHHVGDDDIVGGGPGIVASVQTDAGDGHAVAPAIGDAHVADGDAPAAPDPDALAPLAGGARVPVALSDALAAVDLPVAGVAVITQPQTRRRV